MQRNSRAPTRASSQCRPVCAGSLTRRLDCWPWSNKEDPHPARLGGWGVLTQQAPSDEDPCLPRPQGTEASWSRYPHGSHAAAGGHERAGLIEERDAGGALPVIPVHHFDPLVDGLRATRVERHFGWRHHARELDERLDHRAVGAVPGTFPVAVARAPLAGLKPRVRRYLGRGAARAEDDVRDERDGQRLPRRTDIGCDRHLPGAFEYRPRLAESVGSREGPRGHRGRAPRAWGATGI